MTTSHPEPTVNEPGSQNFLSQPEEDINYFDLPEIDENNNNQSHELSRHSKKNSPKKPTVNGTDQQNADETNNSVTEFTVGVGPWKEEYGTEPPDTTLPENNHYDPELIEHGDRRNVVDPYRYWTREAIVEDLDTKRHGFHIAIENWQHDMNIGTVVRNANAFLAKEVHIIGKKRWNRRGAMVTDRYQHVRHHPTVEDFVEWATAENLPIIGIDNFDDSVPLESYNLPKDCVLVFGQEGPGLSPEVQKIAQATLSISQFGSTRSINAAGAAAIAMHAWVRRHVYNQKP